MQDGWLSSHQSQDILSRRRNASQAKLHPLEYLAELELANQKNVGQILDLDTLTRWLADSASQPYYHIDPLKIDAASVTPLMSLAYAERHQILAVEVNENEILVASAQPWHKGWEDNLKHINRREIKRVVSNPAEIRRYTGEFYKLAKSISGASREGGINAINTGNLEQLLQLGDAQTPDANDQHIINIVDWLLQYAFDQRASDIHVEPRRDKGHIRFRIDGVLHTVYDMPAQVLAAVNSRLKILGRMNVAEKRKPQDGRLKTRSTEGNEVELRLSTLPTAFGEKMVMRIFDPDVLLKGFRDLGFSKEDDKRWHQMVGRPNGIVLVTGPTGSGKTTTLYSTLKELATSKVNVCTIEDPIEMVEPAFNQMQVHHNIDLTFASGVRALLRQDPDIIMVGEIRDLETAEMAIQAALTGHLVLSTLHTNDAPSAITRLLELGVPDYLIRATVLGVMAQRLVRTLCPDCKQPVKMDEQGWKELTKPWVAEPPAMGMKPVGCLSCRNTGYRGRAGVYEIMPLEGAVREQLGERTDVDKMRAAAIRNGMHSLRLSGAQKVAQGLTTIDEVLRVTPVTTLN
ncbi:GspE/PulE family protein [Parendozoicomonas sp. Alg238-R29]|uniref:GspE/PulE family protein n=1 Tax=Parendozoicomonas sp. Alg238-R29 TaxID=2993446 RepID=UPI00248D9115|nr:GspE/PulE family protein [Parendozoicomonas sp. Alg238-R29]